MKQHEIKSANNGKYIDAIPALKWDEWKDCTYSGAVALALNAMGKNATYEQVRGLSGSAFHLSMCYGWDPGSCLVHTSYHFLGVNSDRNALRAFGMDYRCVADADAYAMEVQKSIDAGIPVLILGARGAPEWEILTGYETTPEGVRFFGRSYFDAQAAEDELRTENKYTLFNNFPGEYPHDLLRFLDTPCEPTPPKEALKISLQACLDLFKPNANQVGYEAYKFLLDNLATVDSGHIALHLCLLQDARRAAHVYLTESADLLQGENKTKLLEAAALYKKMFDTLSAVMPYETKWEWDKNTHTPLPAQTSKTLVEALETIVGLEKQVRVFIAEIIKGK